MKNKGIHCTSIALPSPNNKKTKVFIVLKFLPSPDKIYRILTIYSYTNQYLNPCHVLKVTALHTIS